MFILKNRDAFTFIELIVMMVLLVIMVTAAIIGFNITTTELDANANNLKSNIQFAQDLAMTHGSIYGFRPIDASNYEIYESSPGSPAQNPLTNSDLLIDMAPVQFQGSPPTFEFDENGFMTFGSNATITLTQSGSTRTLTVQDQTGHVTLAP